jgi:hypothetical protein
MIVRGFKSVMWVATVGGAALACYMVSLQVATERSELAKVEAQIVAAKRDIRSLQTELGTRGRLSQLENWNAEVLALSAPASAQFLQNEFTLARFEQREPTVEDRTAEVRLASLEASNRPQARPAAPVIRAVAPVPPPSQPLVHRASFTAPGPEVAPRPTITQSRPTQPRPAPQPKPAPQAKAASASKPEDPVAKNGKPKAEPVRVAAAVKSDKSSAGKGKAETRRAGRLDSGLASEIGAAARAEKTEKKKPGQSAR